MAAFSAVVATSAVLFAANPAAARGLSAATLPIHTDAGVEAQGGFYGDVLGAYGEEDALGAYGEDELGVYGGYGFDSTDKTYELHPTGEHLVIHEHDGHDGEDELREHEEDELLNGDDVDDIEPLTPEPMGDDVKDVLMDDSDDSTGEVVETTTDKEADAADKSVDGPSSTKKKASPTTTSSSTIAPAGAAVAGVAALVAGVAALTYAKRARTAAAASA